MNVGMLGFGVVGRGVYEILKNLDNIELVKVFSRSKISADDVLYVDNFDQILNDEKIDTVVEAIGGIDHAYKYVKSAICAGKNIVTANKALICKYYDELIPLALEKGVKIRFTAAVGGGIGWLPGIERASRVQKINSVFGIMNGTCNYILDNMTKNSVDYDEILKSAQELGYAEADPSADVEGIDTWNKIIISANVAFKSSLEIENIPCLGISNISASDIANFNDNGYVCKLLGKAEAHGNECSCFVQPTLIKNSLVSSAVPDNYNIIFYDGSLTGKMSFYGQGAGRYPTASNVVEDLVDVSKGIGFYTEYGCKMPVNNQKVKYRYYVSKNWDGECSDKWGEAAITDNMSVEYISKWAVEHPDVFIAAIYE